MTTLLALHKPSPPPDFTRLSGWGLDCLEIAAGTTYALLGPNGSGKSTMLRLLAGILQGNGSHRVVKDNCSIHFVPTDIMQLLLPWYSVQRNLHVFVHAAVPNRRSQSKILARADSIARHILPEANLEDCMDTRPGQLSSGQRAALCLGLVFAIDADVLLLDETLAHLSEEAAHRAAHLLRERASDGRSTVLATHNRHFVKQYGFLEFHLA